MKLDFRLWCPLLLGALGAVSVAEIKNYTLPEMVREADGAVYGQITGAHAFRRDTLDGTAYYFTTLTIQGWNLYDDRPLTIDVTYRGGSVTPTDACYDSEAPAADDVQVGKKVVAFYRWVDDLGAGVWANALIAAHGGIYRTADGPRGPAVLGRGEGYAIAANARLEQLTSAIHLLAAEKPQRKK